MSLVIIKDFISELSQDSLSTFKEDTKDYLSFYFTDINSITLEEFIEKIYEYLKCFEIRTNTRDGDLFYVYANELYSDIANVCEKDSKASKYLVKANKIKEDFKKGNLDDDEEKDSLETFTKIYFAILSMLIKQNTKKISEVDFRTSKIDYASIKGYLYRSNDNIFEKIADKIKGTDDIEEIVHDVIENEERLKIYSKKAFARMLLNLLYLRLIDYEMGKE